MAERCLAINPLVQVDVVPMFLTGSNLEKLLDRGFDLVLDACDSFRTKVEMIAWCRRRKLPLIVSGSAGGRTDPTQIRIRDLSRTEHDALLALVRVGVRHFWAAHDRRAPQLRVLEGLPIAGLLGACIALALYAGSAMRFTGEAPQALHTPAHYIHGVLAAQPHARTAP